MTTPSQDDMVKIFGNFDVTKPIPHSHKLYVNCDEVRGKRNLAQEIKNDLNLYHLTGENYAHFLFTGHVGSGKSSELLTVREKLENLHNFHVMYLNAEDVLDLNNVYPTDLLLVIANLLYKDDKINLSSKLLSNVKRWFGEVILETTEEEKYEAEVRGEVEMGAQIPLVGKLLSRFTGVVSKGGGQRKEIRIKLKANVSGLLALVNQMLQEAETKVRQNGKEGLVIIIDNLEKMNRDVIEDENEKADVFLYINNGNLLAGLNCHLICTVPIALLYSPQGPALEHRFKCYLLPLVKIKQTRTNQFNDPAIDKLIEIIEKRLEDIPLFQEKKLMRKVVEFSGGNIKYMVRIMREIVLESASSKTFPVDDQIVQQVFSTEIRTHARAVYDSYIPRLVEVYKTKNIEQKEGSPDWEMLQSGWVLAYPNDREEWYDVAPVIQELRRFKRTLKGDA